ncbi:hypothetical protein W5O_03343 [Candida albicans Ca6]|nr:hypothetical protein W5O_03343 [Candida albicans Ca6]
MTDTQPRKIRKVSTQEQIEDYEKLRQRIKNHFKDALKGKGSSMSLHYIDEITELYKRVQSQKVKDTRVHLEDSEVFKEASDFAALNARNIVFDDSGIALDDKEFFKCLRRFAVTDPSLLSRNDIGDNDGNNSNDEDDVDDDDSDDVDDDDSDDEEEAITDEYTFNKTNWLKLGIFYHQVSKKSISVDFLNGPLKAEKRKIVRARNVDDTKGSGMAKTARQVQASDISGNQEQNTANMVKSVYQTYIEKYDGNGVNLFKFFINPRSFGQSVENLFYTSFLVKDGRLKLYVNNDGVPCVQRVSSDEIREAQLESNKIFASHHIASFNYKAWKKYTQLYNIREAFLGHRDEPEDQMPPEDIIDYNDEEPIPSSQRRDSNSSD